MPRRKPFADGPEELERLFQKNKDTWKPGTALGRLLDNSRFRVRLTRKKPPTTSSIEVFEVRDHPNDPKQYLEARVTAGTRLHALLEQNGIPPGRAYVHHIVSFLKTGRKCPRGYHLHHIDINCKNNRSPNIVATLESSHSVFHLRHPFGNATGEKSPTTTLKIKDIPVEKEETIYIIVDFKEIKDDRISIMKRSGVRSDKCKKLAMMLSVIEELGGKDVSLESLRNHRKCKIVPDRSIHDLLATLIRQGFLEKTDRGCYSACGA
jgi:hypothetical protein